MGYILIGNPKGHSKMLKIKTLGTILITLLFSSCNKSSSGEKLKEGSVSYNIEYLKKTDNKLVQALLPSNIVFTFNEKNTKTSFSGNFGLYELSYFANKTDNLWSIVYRLKRNTYLYQQNLYETKVLAHNIKIVEIIETDETKLIANYECKKIIIKTDSEKYKQSDIYYTDRIKFDFPILLNLFGQIDGVLMDFELPQGDMLMHIKADEIVSKKINLEEFIIPTEAQKIKQNMMLDLLKTEF